MTKSRIASTREIYGLIGRFSNRSEILRIWNAYFTEQGIDAAMVYYPTTEANLPERLSEMFHFDRRLYLVSDSLSEPVRPLLDQADPDQLNLIRNAGGVLHGIFVPNFLDPKSVLNL